MWNIFKKAPQKPSPIERRPFLYDSDKTEKVLELYKDMDDLLFENRTEISKRKKYY